MSTLDQDHRVHCFDQSVQVVVHRQEVLEYIACDFPDGARRVLGQVLGGTSTLETTAERVESSPSSRLQ
jgi:hypothetical protein